jgi:hypothetical protein
MQLSVKSMTAVWVRLQIAAAMVELSPTAFVCRCTERRRYRDRWRLCRGLRISHLHRSLKAEVVPALIRLCYVVICQSSHAA